MARFRVKRNRFVTLKGADKSVNRELETKARTLAGWKAYITNIDGPTPEFVIGAYHQLRRIENSFARVKGRFGGAADLSPDRGLDPCAFGDRDGSTRGDPGGRGTDRLVDQEVRDHRPPLPDIEIRVGDQTITAADPLPDELADALSAIRGAH